MSDIETLALAARHAHELAPIHCRDLGLERSCERVHAIWPVLKLLGIVASPAADGEFICSALSALPKADRPLRILVSGSSDHGILEQVWRGLGARRDAAAITVLDRCDTPLRICERIGAAFGWRFTTASSDIFTFAPTVLFDAIVAHSFVDQLAAADWPRLVAHWRDLLSPAGCVITVNRVRSASEARQDAATFRSSRTFDADVAAMNTVLAAALRLPAEETLRRLDAYWAARQPSTMRSSAFFAQLFRNAGFHIRESTEALAPMPGREPPFSRRVRLVAEKQCQTTIPG